MGAFSPPPGREEMGGADTRATHTCVREKRVFGQPLGKGVCKTTFHDSRLLAYFFGSNISSILGVMWGIGENVQNALGRNLCAIHRTRGAPTH